MIKIVINADYGGFSLSDAAVQRYAQIKGITLYSTPGLFGFTNYTTVPSEQVVELAADDFYALSQEERIAHNKRYSTQHFNYRDIPRDDPVLVQVVEELGDKASGRVSDLRIVEIPDDVKWGIHDYDGNEHVEEQHRTWR